MVLSSSVINRRVAFAVVLTTGVFGGCTDKAARATNDSLNTQLSLATAARDSLQSVIQSRSAENDRAMAQAVEASKFADQIDAELRQVRSLSSRLSVNKSDESGATQAAEVRDDILDRLKQLRQRLASRQAQVRALLDSVKTMRSAAGAATVLLTDLNARLASRDRDIAVFQEEIQQLRSQNTQLVSEKSTLTDTVRAMDVRENRVYYVVGPRRQLLNEGVVSEEGGSRGLLIVKLGKTLVPARSLDETKFTLADRREALTIPLPRSDRWYRIVSRHDCCAYRGSTKGKRRLISW